MVDSQMVESERIRHEGLLFDSNVCIMIFRLLYLGRAVGEYIGLVNSWIATYLYVCIVGA